MKLRVIAARLNEAAARAPACVHVTAVWRNARTGKYKADLERERECACDTDTLRFGTLVIRCRAGAEHLRAVAAKYERGVRSLRAGSGLPRREPLSRGGLGRPADGDALLRALEAECGADNVTAEAA